MSALKRQPKSKGTTKVGFVNLNRQRVVRATGLPGTDHRQKLYELECGNCGARYLANGSDIHGRLCPKCQSGREGTQPAIVESASDMGASWTVADAKARFSELIDKAVANGPQSITRNGKRTAIIVSAEEWERKTRRKGSLLEFFQSAPEGLADLDLERIRDEPRDIDL